MHVSSLDFYGFGPAKANRPFHISLPTRGIVCIQGPNESGKSSVLEAVSYAIWGKDIRGTSLVHEKGKSAVNVYTDLGAVKRQSTTPKITMTSPSGLVQSWDTLKPAQEAIEARYGSVELWLATSVFSTAERASGFCETTDKFRKLLLETVLNVGAFDQALTRCRADLASARTALARAENESRSAATTLASAEATVNALAKAAVVFRPEDAAALAELETDAADADTLVAGANRSIAELDVEARGLRLITAGSCTACGQMVNADYTERENQRVRDRRATIEIQRTQLRNQIAIASDSVDDAELQRLRDLKRAATAPRADAAEASRGLSDAKLAVTKAAGALEKARDLVSILEEAERALGYKGIRARITGGAVKHLSDLASVWLQRIGGAGEIQVTMADDKIDLALTKVGGGVFKAGSGGVRRRVSVSVLLGLVDLVTAAYGKTSTLFFDEVFDAIDAEGAAGVVAALSDMAEDRCCVVITHMESVATAFQRAGARLVRLTKD